VESARASKILAIGHVSHVAFTWAKGAVEHRIGLVVVAVGTFPSFHGRIIEKTRVYPVAAQRKRSPKSQKGLV
jgi:hypothetical protein